MFTCRLQSANQVVIPKKEHFDEQVVDFAFKKIIETKTVDMETHFVYAGHFLLEEQLISRIFKKMHKYSIKKVMLTSIHLYRTELITQEKRDNYCNGNENEKKSINDDLESLFGDIRLDKEPDNVYVETYFLPMAPEKESEDYDSRSSFEMNQDENQAEMELSKSDSRYLHVYCTRRTYIIENSWKRKARRLFFL